MAKSRTERKRYIAQRPADDESGDVRVIVITETNRSYALPRVPVYPEHGIDWGHMGPATANLALSILSDHFGDQSRAQALYQSFKSQMLQELGHYQWSMTTDNIELWLEVIGVHHGRS